MIILGIHEGHDAGAAILKDGKILAAINEERLIREKLFTGIPKLAIKKVIQLAKITPDQIDRVAIAGTLGVMASLGWTNISFKKKLYQFLCNHMYLPRTKLFIPLQRTLFKPLRNKKVKNYIQNIGIKAPIEYVDHHLSHAASAYYTSGNKNSLIITSDGSGDAVSSSVYKGINGELIKLKEIPTYHSIAYFYAYITLISGFKMFRHEGKITGLAAHGDPDKCYKIFQKAFAFKGGKPKNTFNCIGQTAIKKLKKYLKDYSREDYSAAIQKRTENVMKKFVDYYADKTDLRDVAVAGGIFANVKINQRIAESEHVNSLFIHPHMGDGGLAVGAALCISAQELMKKGERLIPYKINNTYFGPEFSNEEIEKAIKETNHNGKYIENIEEYIAEKLTQKKIIGHFNGKMEYGPRALGNRSILADPTDPKINDWLNKRLSRTEFMPFAPSILDTGAPIYYKKYEKSKYPSQFMTITFDDAQEAQKANAVVHVDNTTRPQVVSKEQNPRYYKILQYYEQKTGLPLFVNTSFNIHEEPIVCSPEDAIRSFDKGTVDVLVMGNWVLEK